MDGGVGRALGVADLLRPGSRCAGCARPACRRSARPRRRRRAGRRRTGSAPAPTPRPPASRPGTPPGAASCTGSRWCRRPRRCNSSTPSRAKMSSWRRRDQIVFDSTPTFSPRSRSSCRVSIGVRLELGVRVPLPLVLRQGGRCHHHVGQQADVLEGAAQVLVPGSRQMRSPRPGPAARPARPPGLLVDQLRHRPPHGVQVDVVPGRQRAAPVEQDGLDRFGLHVRHGAIPCQIAPTVLLRISTGGAADRQLTDRSCLRLASQKTAAA